MKKIIFNLFSIIFAIAVFSGCQTQQLTERSEETKTFAIDFREYTEKGFLFMPDEYFGEYEVKGIIRTELHPTVRYLPAEGLNITMDGIKVKTFYSGDTRMTQIVKDVDLNQLVEYIYNLAIEWGGDAFTHFDSKIEVDRTDDDPNTSYSYYSISGIVIKRHSK